MKGVSELAPRRPSWSLWAKAIGTIAILTFLAWRIDLTRFWDSIRNARVDYLLVALVSNVLLLGFSTLKWKTLLHAVGLSASVSRLFRLYTIGFFASSFLPGVVGGDVVRWHMTSKHLGGRARVAATILAERATGVAALLALAFPGALYVFPRVDVAPFLLILIAATATLGAVVALVMNRRLVTSLVYRTRSTRVGRVVRRVYGLQRSLRCFSRRTFLVALMYSLLFYVSGGLTFFLVCKSFGAPVSFAGATAVQVLIGVLILIPISLGGLGLAQAGDVYLLGLLGINAPGALGISIARLLINYAYVLMGGVMFVQWNNESRAEESELEGRAEEETAVGESTRPRPVRSV